MALIAPRMVALALAVDTYARVTDMPTAVAPSAQYFIDFTQHRLRWSLTGEGERPTWDAESIAAAEVLLDAAIATCADLPMVVGLPGQSERPPGWSDMSDAEVAAHCDSMARRLEEGVAEYTAAHDRPPRHHRELDLPIAYCGASDFHGVGLDAAGRPVALPVPGGACDL